jgi:uncharacterized membrane protein
MNILVVLLWTALLSFLPISEVRGGIPFAMVNGIPWRWAYPYCAGINALVAPACWIFLSTLHRLLRKMAWYENFFDRFVERARARLRSPMEKWGWLGIAVFVAIPLPMTGAWTGTLGAWALGLGKRKTMLAVILGALVAGAIVTAVMALGTQAFRVFVKEA